MKVFYFLIPLAIVNACNTQHSAITTSDNTNMEKMETQKSGCPDGGICTVVVHKNKKLVFKEDEFGASYSEMQDGNNLVVEYTYARKGPEGTADGNYSEIVSFEIPNSTKNLSKENNSLSEVNLMYEKRCFCRGEAGVYKITDGKLLLEKTDKAIMFDLQFKIDKTSQVVSHITKTVML